MSNKTTDALPIGWAVIENGLRDNFRYILARRADGREVETWAPSVARAWSETLDAIKEMEAENAK